MFFKQGSHIERSLVTATSGGTLTLTNTSETYQVFTGSTTHTLKLPDATTMAVGQRFEVVNTSTGAITVQDSTSATITTVDAGTSKIFRLADNSTAAGTFDATAASAGGAAGLSGQDSAQINSVGAKGYGSTSVVLKYNPEEVGGDYWLTRSSAPVTGFIDNFDLNGFAYAAGGYGGSFRNTNYQYNDDNNAWTAKSNTPIAFAYGATASVGGFGYDLGLQNSSSVIQNGYKYSDSTDAWTALSALVIAQTQAGVSASSGYIVAAGGYYDGVSASHGINSIQLYDYTNNVYLASGMVRSITAAAGGAFSLNNRSYVSCGRNSPNFYNNTDQISLATKSVVISAANPQSKETCGVAAQGFGFTLGGAPASGYYADVQRFSEATGSWMSMASLSSARRQYSSASVNGSPYMVGGDTGSYVATTERYYPFSFLKTAINYRSTATPSSISAIVAMGGLNTTVPVQVRTDGDSWKSFTSAGSPLKQGETLSTKFPAYQLPFVGCGSTSGVAANGLSSNEFYNVNSDTWTARQAFAAARVAANGFSVLGNSYVLGGLNTSNAQQKQNYQYNEITNTSVSKTDVTDTANNTGGGSLNGYGYVYTVGNASYSGTGTKNLFQYNPVSDAWSTKTAQTNDVLQSSLLNQSGFLWMHGGLLNNGTSGGQVFNQQYSDVTNTWASKTNISTGVQSYAGFAMNGLTFVAAGQNSSGTGTNGTQIYNPGTNAWSSGGTVPSSAFHWRGFASGGFGYGAGGYNGSYTGFFYQYNPDSAAWATKTNNGTRAFTANGYSAGSYRNYEMRVGIPAFYMGLGGLQLTSRANMVSVQSMDCNFVVGDRFYGAAGLDGGLVDASTRTNVTQRFDSIINAWMKETNFPAIGNTGGHSSCNTLGGQGYAPGFNTAAGALTATSYKFDPESHQWISITNMPVNSGAGNISGSLNGYIYTNGHHPSIGVTLMHQYSNSTNAWSNKTSSPSGHYTGAAAVQGGFFYSLGGTSVSTANDQYNDASNAWLTKTNLASGAWNTAAINLPVDRFTLFGGYNGANISTVQEFNPAQNVWSLKTSLTTAQREQTCGTFMTGNGVVAGGVTSSYVATAFQYTDSVKNAALSAALLIS